ncbi:hypothetical protein D3C87_1215900 [compost metagenome]
MRHLGQGVQVLLYQHVLVFFKAVNTQQLISKWLVVVQDLAALQECRYGKVVSLEPIKMVGNFPDLKFIGRQAANYLHILFMGSLGLAPVLVNPGQCNAILQIFWVLSELFFYQFLCILKLFKFEQGTKVKLKISIAFGMVKQLFQ